MARVEWSFRFLQSLLHSCINLRRRKGSWCVNRCQSCWAECLQPKLHWDSRWASWVGVQLVNTHFLFFLETIWKHRNKTTVFHCWPIERISTVRVLIYFKLKWNLNYLILFNATFRKVINSPLILSLYPSFSLFLVKDAVFFRGNSVLHQNVDRSEDRHSL